MRESADASESAGRQNALASRDRLTAAVGYPCCGTVGYVGEVSPLHEEKSEAPVMPHTMREWADGHHASPSRCMMLGDNHAPSEHPRQGSSPASRVWADLFA